MAIVAVHLGERPPPALADPRVRQPLHQRRRIRLAQRNPDTFGADIKKMNTARMTLDEVMQSEKFNVMEKQRIKLVYRDIFDQLDNVEW